MLRKIELINEDMNEPALFSEHGYTISYFVKRNPDSHHTEDSAGIYVLNPQTLVFAIADGFGGQKNGELASRFAIEALTECLERNEEGPNLPLREVIAQAYEEANERILKIGTGAATTLVVTEIEQDKVRFYNAGDSMGMLLGGRGKHKLETIQHNPVGLGIESGLVGGRERELERVKHIVTNYVGSNALRIEMTVQKSMSHTDRILTFSDGIADNVDVNKESFSQIPLNLCKAITQKAMTNMQHKSGKIDDISLIVAACL